MWYIHPTEKWINDVVHLMNEQQLKPENSKFMIALFSSMDNEFVDYFKNNKERISSFSGQNFHIFTPLIYDDNLIPDEDWRYMKKEFQSMGIPVDTDPTFVFFNLKSNHGQDYEPTFFAGFKMTSFNKFPNKLKVAIDNCIEINDTTELTRKLSETFLSKNIISDNSIKRDFKQTISNKLPKAKLFVSHSSVDKPFAHKLINELSEDSSLNFWIDEKEILVGDDIQKSITTNLKSSDFLLLLISENSVNSKWVTFEVSQYMGLADNKNIIPIVISKGQQFSEPIDNLIRRLKYLNFTNQDNWAKNIGELKQLIAQRHN